MMQNPRRLQKISYAVTGSVVLLLSLGSSAGGSGSVSAPTAVAIANPILFV